MEALLAKRSHCSSYLLRNYCRGSCSNALYERAPYDHCRVTPDFAELQLFFVKEHATRLAMLLSGEAHIAALPPDLEATALDNGMETITARTPTVPLYAMMGGNFYEEPSGTRQGNSPDLPYSDVCHPVERVPWVNKKVREALNRAIDRDEIQRTLLAGRGDPMPGLSTTSRCVAGTPNGWNATKRSTGTARKEPENCWLKPSPKSVSHWIGPK